MDYYTGGNTTQPYRSELFSYDSTGPNASYISSILVKGWNGSAMVSERRVDFTYYDGSTAYGVPGCIESAAEYAADSSGSLAFAGMYYFRYSGGAPGALRLAAGRGQRRGRRAERGRYAHALRAIPTTDGTPNLLEYSSFAYEYNTLADVNSAETASTGGLRDYSYTYNADLNYSFDSLPKPYTYDQWLWAVREVRPDDTSYFTVYSNFAGQTLLTDLADASGNHWVTFNTYGAKDSPDESDLESTAAPSAIDMGDSSEADDPLTATDQGYNWASNTLSVDLYTGQGLTTDYAYATTTTAVQSTGTSDAAAGDVAGYVQSDSLANGSGASLVKQDGYTYVWHTGDVPTYVVADGASDRNGRRDGQPLCSSLEHRLPRRRGR